MKTLGYLISCQGRQLFMRDAADCSWAYLDDEYTVTELVAKAGEEIPETPPATDDTVERMQILEQLYELEEQQIAEMRLKLEEFVELVEAIVDIAIPTDNIIENKAKILLIAESCKKLLKPKE